MLKFIRGKGQQPSAERQKLQRELFAFRKVGLFKFLLFNILLVYFIDYWWKIYVRFTSTLLCWSSFLYYISIFWSVDILKSVISAPYINRFQIKSAVFLLTPLNLLNTFQDFYPEKNLICIERVINPFLKSEDVNALSCPILYILIIFIWILHQIN